MEISIIAALSENHVIGLNNELPWHFPKDLQHFRDLTLGKPIIMGKNTYLSIGKPLPKRRNIIISKSLHPSPDYEVYSSLDEALLNLKDYPEVMIIGGAKLYQEALPKTIKMYLTIIHHQFHGDTFFPKWSADSWKIVEQQDFPVDHDHPYPFTFLTLARIF